MREQERGEDKYLEGGGRGMKKKNIGKGARGKEGRYKGRQEEKIIIELMGERG